MDGFLNTPQTARTLKLSKSGIRKHHRASALPCTKIDGRIAYPRSFVDGLAEATNGIPVTRDFVLLYKLVWEYNTGTISRQQTEQQINELRRHGQVLNTKEAAKLLGYHSNTISLWRNRGWIRSVTFWRTQLCVRSDIVKLKTLADGFTVYEAAASLGVCPTTVRKRASKGQLSTANHLNGNMRANPREVLAIAEEQAKLKAASLPAPVAAKLLSVSMQRLFRWKVLGSVRTVLIGERPQYVTEDIMALVQHFQTITPGFEWLSPIYTQPAGAKQLWPAAKAIRFLGVVQSQFNNWSRLGLLPFYVRTPAGLCSVRREYVSAYLISLKAYAAGRKITKAVLEEYYAICQENRLVA